MVNASINEAGDESEGEIAEVTYKGEVEESKKERNDNDAKGSRPFCVKILIDFALQEPPKECFFWNRDKEEVCDQPDG